MLTAGLMFSYLCLSWALQWQRSPCKALGWLLCFPHEFWMLNWAVPGMLHPSNPAAPAFSGCSGAGEAEGASAGLPPLLFAQSSSARWEQRNLDKLSIQGCFPFLREFWCCRDAQLVCAGWVCIISFDLGCSVVFEHVEDSEMVPGCVEGELRCVGTCLPCSVHSRSLVECASAF